MSDEFEERDCETYRRRAERAAIEADDLARRVNDLQGKFEAATAPCVHGGDRDCADCVRAAFAGLMRTGGEVLQKVQIERDELRQWKREVSEALLHSWEPDKTDPARRLLGHSAAWIRHLGLDDSDQRGNTK